jgi:MYXO-CTERM domain-containing protein
VTFARAARVVFALALVPATARAASYTVTPAGADTNPGTAAQPWKTLQHAAERVAAGDTVTVEPGTYAGFALCWDHPQDGLPDAPITFAARPGVVIDAKGPYTGDGISLVGCSYVVIEGFEIAHMPGAGIRAVSGGPNAIGVVIRDNDTHDNMGPGIVTSHVDSLLVEGNRATNSGQDGVFVSSACVNPVVRGNLLAGNAGAGLHMTGGVALGGSGIITGALVEKNVIHDNGAMGGSGIECDGVQASRIRNNLVYAEHSSGISLDQADAAVPATNNVVVNNTVIVEPDGLSALEVKSGSTGNRAENNILLALDPSHGSIDVDAASLASFTSDYNVVVDRLSPDGSAFVTLAGWRTMTNQDAHSLVAAAPALFVNEAGNDYHLSATSPAIGAGTTSDAPADDLDGHSRAGGVDVGAYQWCADCATDAGAGGHGEAGAAGAGGGAGDGGAGGQGGHGDASAPVDASASDGATRDAGAIDAGPKTAASSGCGCAVEEEGASSLLGLAVFALAALFVAARRR